MPGKGKPERTSLTSTGLLLVTMLASTFVAYGLSPRDRSSGMWSSANTYNYAPSTRTVLPVSVFANLGFVSNPEGVLRGSVTRLSGSGSQIILDFGKEIGGILTVSFAGSSDKSQNVGLAFSESSLFVGRMSDASNFIGPDGALFTAGTGLAG